MRRWPAVRVWMSDVWRASTAMSGEFSVRHLLLLAVGTLVVLGAWSTAMTSGWRALSADLAVNVAAAGIVAGTAIAGFVLSTQRRALRRMLVAVSPGEKTGGEQQRSQAAAVAAQIRDRRQPGMLLIEAAPGSGRALFLRTLVAALGEQETVSIVLTGQDLYTRDIASATSFAIRGVMRAAGAEDAPLARTVDVLSARRRLVVIVDGMDASHRTVTASSTVQMVRDRLGSLTATGLPVVALIEPGTVPPEHTSISLRLPGIDAEAMLSLAGLPAHLPTDWVVARARLGAARRLAGSIQQRGIEARTIGEAIRRRQQGSGDRTAVMALEETHSELSNFGPTIFVTRPLWEAGFLDRRNRTWPFRSASSSAMVLDRLGRHLLAFEVNQVGLGELMSRAEPGRSLGGSRVTPADIIAGLAGLERQGLLERAYHGGEVLIRFTEPLVREFVAGVSAVRLGLPFAYTARRGSAALTGEVVERFLRSSRRPDLWARVLAFTAQHGLLTCAFEAAAVLSARLDGPPPSLPGSWLAEAWTNADDRDRTSFVRRLPERTDDQHVRHLWSRLAPPLFGQTTHLVRRTVARHLGAAGPQAWDILADDWTALVTAGARGGLAWHQRANRSWKSYGSALASLCWILPSVALTSARPQALRLLQQLAAISVPGGDTDLSDEPDIGIEISLAEGFKDMAFLALVREEELSPSLIGLLLDLTAHCRSWVSQILGLQALTLTAAADPALTPRVRRHCTTLGSRGAHPLVRRYATVIDTALVEHDGDLNAFVHRIVWADDTEALAGAGGTLRPEVLHVLASVTLVLNLVESRIRGGGDRTAAHTARVSALVRPSLPGCLRSPLLAQAYGRVDCSCKLGLCGSSEERTIRVMSASFAYRCLSDRVAYTRFRSGLDRAVATHLRRIARQQSAPPPVADGELRAEVRR